MRPTLALLLLSACTQRLPELANPCGDALEPGQYVMVTDASRKRHAIVNVPEGARFGPRDAVIILHGGGGNNRDAERITGYDQAGQDLGFITVYPNGTGVLGIERAWNAGSCCGRPASQDLDDTAYLNTISATLREQLCVDRVLGAGFSNGGMMALRWACEGGDVDAVVESSGALLQEECPQAKPIPLYLVHGTADPVVPFDGGFGNKAGNAFPSFNTTSSRAARIAGCTDASPSSTVLQDDEACTTFDCEVPLRSCVLQGWLHRWPGGINLPDPARDLSPRSLAWFNEVVPRAD